MPTLATRKRDQANDEGPHQRTLAALDVEERQLKTRLLAIAGERAEAIAQVMIVRDRQRQAVIEAKRPAKEAAEFERLVEWTTNNLGEARRTLQSRHGERQRLERDGNQAGVAAVTLQIERLERAIPLADKRRAERELQRAVRA